MSAASSDQFVLSAELLGHDGDVKAVSFPSPDTVCTTSRDMTARVWNRSSEPPRNSFAFSIVRKAEAYINSIVTVKSSSDYPAGLVVVGSNDGMIEAVTPSATANDNADRLLIGHAGNVCNLALSPSATAIVSSSWDATAQVWNTRNWETESVLEHGDDARCVWAAAFITDTLVATGAADSQIRIFDVSKKGQLKPKSVINTPQPVRSLCRAPSNHLSGAEIVSASNDDVIRLWKLNGQQVGELHGHQSFIYSLATLPNGDIVSASEDRSLRVWRGSECIQTITHPAISVWSVAVCEENGDIVTGASDGVARIFTRSSERKADADVLSSFETAVQGSSIPQQQMGGINKGDIPGPDALQTKTGQKEGQIQMIKEHDGTVTAYQWSVGTGQWVKIGTVVDSVGSTGKKIPHGGKSWDYVFDVDIEDGKPPLKLPYNLNENAYDAAVRFLEQNDLPGSYLEQTARFIVENTQGASMGDGTSSNTHAAAPPSASLQTKVLPQNEYLALLAAKHEAMFKKIQTVNEGMISSGAKDVALNPSELSALAEIQQKLGNPGQIDQSGLDVVVKIVTQWSYADSLVGLDLLRCLAPSPLAAQYTDLTHGSIVNLAIAAATTRAEEAGTPINENCVMMALRLIVNLCVTEQGRKAVSSSITDVVDFLERVLGSGKSDDGTGIGKSNRNVVMAATTALVNLAVLSHKTVAVPVRVRMRLYSLLGTVLCGQSDSEVLYRGLVALGTLLTSARDDLGDGDAQRWIQTAVRNGSEKKVQDVGVECARLL